MPLVSNPFSFGRPNMTLHKPSSIPTSNFNASFGSGGTSPPYNPFPFGGGHIIQPFPLVGGWNTPSSEPNPSYGFQGWNGKMGGGSTLYILSVYPSSTMPMTMNTFIMENPPQTSGVALGGNQFYNIGNPPDIVPSVSTL
jgi:hypothetical protein